MSTPLPFDIEAFLAEPLRPAQVASVNGSGTPILGSFWFLFAEGLFWFSSRPLTPLAIAVKGGAEAAVIVDEFSPPEDIRQVRVRGRGRLEPHDPMRVEQMYRRYLGDDRAGWPDLFRIRPEDPTWALWTVTPTSGVAVAYPYFDERKVRWESLSDSPFVR
jgi:Pyridoxamine 5'-phosphate oxidase